LPCGDLLLRDGEVERVNLVGCEGGAGDDHISR
jgi:hypothetical protein